MDQARRRLARPRPALADRDRFGLSPTVLRGVNQGKPRGVLTLPYREAPGGSRAPFIFALPAVPKIGPHADPLGLASMPEIGPWGDPLGLASMPEFGPHFDPMGLAPRNEHGAPVEILTRAYPRTTSNATKAASY